MILKNIYMYIYDLNKTNKLLLLKSFNNQCTQLSLLIVRCVNSDYET